MIFLMLKLILSFWCALCLIFVAIGLIGIVFKAIFGLGSTVLGLTEHLHDQRIPGSCNGRMLSEHERWNFKPEEHGLTRH